MEKYAVGVVDLVKVPFSFIKSYLPKIVGMVTSHFKNPIAKEALAIMGETTPGMKFYNGEAIAGWMMALALF